MEENYDARRVAYITDMKEMFKQIPLTMIKTLTPKKVHKLMIEIGGGWYMRKRDKVIPLLRRSKIGKKHKIRRMKKI